MSFLRALCVNHLRSNLRKMGVLNCFDLEALKEEDILRLCLERGRKEVLDIHHPCFFDAQRLLMAVKVLSKMKPPSPAALLLSSKQR